jgi:hypothetical protein
MARLVVKDKKKVLRAIARDLISTKKRFKVLKEVNILYVWRLGDVPEYDDEGRAILAATRKLPVRERDIYGYDVEIRVWRDGWKRLSKKKHRRTMWHELNHIEVEQGENFSINKDDDGRIILRVRQHDVVITTFEDELKKFGLEGRDVSSATILSRALKKRKRRES